MGKRVNLSAIVTVILIIGLMAITVGDSTGSSIWMDRDLEDSSASFIGEVSGDYSGLSVSMAGDVNGDGYDDILIGSRNNDQGGRDAGQTYLIFGNVTGWSMDTDLSKADASFIGEAAGDHSGSSVAIAGDVNGDGYNDILIGAPRDDEGDSDAGQTYVFFGNASGWSMDMKLSNADASFWGEDQGDSSGSSVAGAGDVNGDGYDDILIGAENNQEEGRHAGQTYLIFGNASGWSMDMDLSNANASFVGEYGDDLCGHSVAGAGDFNDDGYDDILIGAYGNDEGGSGAGQTYLFLGRATGWSMDTDLTTADMSFWGEAGGDRSGSSVAGVGDINDDGYDDILINAYNNDEGGSNAGQTYLILGNNEGWATDLVLSDADASFWGEDANDRSGWSIAGAGDINGDGYADILIGAMYNDEGRDDAGQTYLILGKASGWSMDTNLSQAYASFIGEKTEDNSGYSVAGAGDVNGDGYDDIMISTIRNAEGGTNAGQTYLVFAYDDAPPKIEMDSTRSVTTTGDLFTFNITASDNTGILNVTIEFWYGPSSSHINITADLSSGYRMNGTWLLDIAIPSNSTDTLHYVVHVRDWAFHIIRSETKDVLVYDDDPPVMVEDLTQSNASTGDAFTFSVNATDNINLSRVSLDYWYGDDGARTNVSMTHVLGDLWDLSITAPSDSLETLHYLIYLEDNSTNHNATAIRDVMVVDNDPPTFGEDASPDLARTQVAYNFSVSIEDNIGLADVWVEYWYGNGTRTNASMDLMGDMWEHLIVVEDTLEDLHYVVSSIDTSGNMASSEERIVDVIDVRGPYIINEGTERTATTGDPHEFTITAGDNLGLRMARLWYIFGEGLPAREMMEVVSEWPSGNVLYSVFIDVPSDLSENITYSYELEDLSGLTLRTHPDTISVVDDDLPEIVEDLSDTTATTGEVFHARIRVADNIGIDIVMAGKDLWTATDVDGQGNGVYEQEMTMADNHVGPWYSTVLVLDLSGNELFYEINTPDVVDNDPPELRNDLTQDEAMKGGTLLYGLEVWENVDAYTTLVWVEYRFGQGPLQNESMERAVGMENVIDCTFGIDVPRDAEGPITYRFIAVDTAGLWNSMEEGQVSLYNPPPVLSDITTWQVTESTDAQLDLAPNISDLNDDEFTVSCSDDQVAVEGLVLKVRHDEAVADRTVTLTVSDGEAEVGVDLTIHVVNVNDLPVITDVLPEDGSIYTKGKRIVFTVNTTDEDGDALTITWKDGEEVLGTGSPFEYRKLGKGNHTITVVVDDGTGMVEDRFMVSVTETEVEEPFGYGWALVAIVVVILIALAAVMVQRSGKTDK